MKGGVPVAAENSCWETAAILKKRLCLSGDISIIDINRIDLLHLLSELP